MEVNKIKALVSQAEKIKEEKGWDFRFNLNQLKQEMREYEESTGVKKEICQVGVEYFSQVLQNSL